MNHSESSPDVILFTRGSKGDLYPFLRIGKGLIERGCKVTLLSNFCYENYALQEGFDFLALDDEDSFNTMNMPEFHSNLPLLLKFFKDHIVAHLEKEVDAIVSKATRKNTVILAHGNDYLAPLIAMEKTGIPVDICVLAPSFTQSFSLFEVLLRVLSDQVNHVRTKVGLEPVQDWKKWLHSFRHCFAFWPSWFYGDANAAVPDAKYIGFLSIDNIEENPLQEDIKDFIDNDAANILITHGTSRPFDDDYFRRGINACYRFDCKIIVSTPFRELLPETLPANVMWVEFCPFHELLPLVNLIIHHGGIGTVREAIANAVPQLIIGQGFDRQHNGRLVKNLRLGDLVSSQALNEELLYRKVCELLGDQIIKQKCEQYKSSIADENALEAFYDTIANARSTCFSIVKNNKEGAVIQNILHEDREAIPAAKVTKDSGNTSEKTGQALKGELLLKILKEYRK